MMTIGIPRDQLEAANEKLRKYIIGQVAAWLHDLRFLAPKKYLLVLSPQMECGLTSKMVFGIPVIVSDEYPLFSIGGSSFYLFEAVAGSYKYERLA